MLVKDQVAFCQIPMKPCLFSVSGCPVNSGNTPRGSAVCLLQRGRRSLRGAKRLADVPTAQTQRGGYSPASTFPNTGPGACEDGVALHTRHSPLPGSARRHHGFLPPRYQRAEQCQARYSEHLYSQSPAAWLLRCTCARVSFITRLPLHPLLRPPARPPGIFDGFQSGLRMSGRLTPGCFSMRVIDYTFMCNPLF